MSTSIQLLAHSLAARVPAMAQDCTINNAHVIEKEIEAVFKAKLAQMDFKCCAPFELVNGETVTPCDLPRWHTGPHKGYCLGSRCSWPEGFVSEEELLKSKD